MYFSNTVFVKNVYATKFKMFEKLKVNNTRFTRILSDNVILFFKFHGVLYVYIVVFRTRAHWGGYEVHIPHKSSI